MLSVRDLVGMPSGGGMMRTSYPSANSKRSTLPLFRPQPLCQFPQWPREVLPLPLSGPACLQGDRPINVEDSAGSLEMPITLAQSLLLPPDIIKEKESSLDRLERTTVSHGIRAIQKMIEVCGRACHGDAKLTRLTAKNDRLLGENNRLGEENSKLRDVATQLGQQPETRAREGEGERG
ncbi:hypothetical protein RHMOL_Rhmol08G0192500 [Rhododendron molle]|uniref:Uncharacterized protein n=1 Tax=Rhododendron molle TaxID=49168 RepID=A0ACC0MQC4_RHOML|nr:hypothetical protein RHMOL_Rhmol08G0192500 [Rhododendron molle]